MEVKDEYFAQVLSLRPTATLVIENDIELLFNHLPEPIDLEIDHVNGNLYWTDRGDGPNGNTLNRASIRNKNIGEHEILSFGLKEGIGLSVDVENDRVYFGDLMGHIYSATLDGFNRRDLFSGNRAFTGIVYVPSEQIN
jgi:hypothetical protein